jgi:hypothetical protein
MEIATPETIAAILSRMDDKERHSCGRRMPPAGEAGRGVSRKPLRGRRRCTCGSCSRCLDDARWEKIYNEKFADSTYYSGVRPRLGGSSLSVI